MPRFKVRYYLFIILLNLQYTIIHSIDLIHVYRRNAKEFRKYRAHHFFPYILMSALKTCWNYRGQTVLKFDFGTKDGGLFLTLRFKVQPEI